MSAQLIKKRNGFKMAGYRLWNEQRKEWERDGVWITLNGNLVTMRHGCPYFIKNKTHILQRSTGRNDLSGKEIYEGDIIESHQGNQVLSIVMVIRYGTYEAFCPADGCYMDNVGFYAEAVGFPQMPLGPLEDYAKVIGNIFENRDLLLRAESVTRE